MKNNQINLPEFRTIFINNKKDVYNLIPFERPLNNENANYYNKEGTSFTNSSEKTRTGPLIG